MLCYVMLCYFYDNICAYDNFALSARPTQSEIDKLLSVITLTN